MNPCDSSGPSDSDLDKVASVGAKDLAAWTVGFGKRETPCTPGDAEPDSDVHQADCRASLSEREAVTGSLVSAVTCRSRAGCRPLRCGAALVGWRFPSLRCAPHGIRPGGGTKRDLISNE